MARHTDTGVRQMRACPTCGQSLAGARIPAGKHRGKRWSELTWLELAGVHGCKPGTPRRKGAAREMARRRRSGVREPTKVDYVS